MHVRRAAAAAKCEMPYWSSMTGASRVIAARASQPTSCDAVQHFTSLLDALAERGQEIRLIGTGELELL